MKNAINLTIFFIIIIFQSIALSFSDVNFNHSNGLDLMKKYSAKYLDPNAEKELNLLRENYERLKPSKNQPSSQVIIPRIIHLIWLGNKTMPINYRYYLETWKQYHPTWEIKLWNREAILKENFPNMDLFLLARSHAEQADLIRYEILNRYGGLYIDTDIECFTNFDELHYRYDFYVNMEPPALNKKRVTIANNMIASVPNHYILTQTLNNIRENWKKNEEYFETNFSNSWTSFGRSAHNLAVQRTMYPLSDGVFNFLETQDQDNYKSIILPSGYNIPMYVVNNHPILNFLSNSFRGRAKLSNKIEIQPETMSFHFYDKQNSLMSMSDFSTALFENCTIKGLFYKLLKFRNKYYLAFRDLYNKNFPTQVNYNVQAIIPKTIYIDIDGMPAKELDSTAKQWKLLNPDFTIKLINSNELTTYIPAKLKPLESDDLDLIGAFYLLYKEGGVFVKHNFKPANLKEFNYKYAYYGLFKNLSKIFSNIYLSTDLIAFAPNHTMLYNLINNLEDEFNENSKIDYDHLEKIYLDNAYKYYSLDGESIILTEEDFNKKR